MPIGTGACPPGFRRTRAVVSPLPAMMGAPGHLPNAPGGGDAAPLPETSLAHWPGASRGVLSLLTEARRGSHNVIVQLAHDRSYSERVAPRRPGAGTWRWRLAALAGTIGVGVLLIWALTTPVLTSGRAGFGSVS